MARPEFREPSIPWKDSLAKRLLRHYILAKEVPLTPDEILPGRETPMPLREIYTKREEFKLYDYGKFSSRLSSLRNSIKREMNASGQNASNQKFVDWRKHPAKDIILCDLETGVLEIDEDQVPAKEAWDAVYKHLEEFSNVPFEQFELRLHDHRQQVLRRMGRCEAEEEALVRDRLLHPRESHNRRGEPVFDLSNAKQLLRDDVSNNRNKQMSRAQLQSSRDEYKQFKPKKFKERIYQEVKRQKFINYLEMKRTLKEKDRRSRIG